MAGDAEALADVLPLKGGIGIEALRADSRIYRRKESSIGFRLLFVIISIFRFVCGLHQRCAVDQTYQSTVFLCDTDGGSRTRWHQP